MGMKMKGSGMGFGGGFGGGGGGEWSPLGMEDSGSGRGMGPGLAGQTPSAPTGPATGAKRMTAVMMPGGMGGARGSGGFAGFKGAGKFGGLGVQLPTTPKAEGTAKKKKVSHVRTEFIILLFWREPTPSDELLPAKLLADTTQQTQN